MACPRCGCKETYTYNDEDAPDDDSWERCAACGIVFNIEDHADEDEEFDPKEAGRRAEFDAEMRLDAFGPVHG